MYEYSSNNGRHWNSNEKLKERADYKVNGNKREPKRKKVINNNINNNNNGTKQFTETEKLQQIGQI